MTSIQPIQFKKQKPTQQDSVINTSSQHEGVEPILEKEHKNVTYFRSTKKASSTPVVQDDSSTSEEESEKSNVNSLDELRSTMLLHIDECTKKHQENMDKYDSLLHQYNTLLNTLDLHRTDSIVFWAKVIDERGTYLYDSIPSTHLRHRKTHIKVGTMLRCCQSKKTSFDENNQSYTWFKVQFIDSTTAIVTNRWVKAYEHSTHKHLLGEYKWKSTLLQ